MTIPRAVLDGVVSGELDLAFRRWTRADAQAGWQPAHVRRMHLELIEARPRQLVETIAESIGRTESLRPGYRLSPRGRAVLRHLRSLD